MQNGVVYVNDEGEIVVSWRGAMQMVPSSMVFIDRDTLYLALLAIFRDKGQYKKMKSLTGGANEIAQAIEVLDIGQPFDNFETLVDWLWKQVSWSVKNIVDWSHDTRICPFISVLYSSLIECLLVIKVFKHKDDPTTHW